MGIRQSVMQIVKDLEEENAIPSGITHELNPPAKSEYSSRQWQKETHPTVTVPDPRSSSSSPAYTSLDANKVKNPASSVKGRRAEVPAKVAAAEDRWIKHYSTRHPALLCSTSHSHSILENTLTSVTVTNEEEENKEEEEECENEESSYSLEGNEIDSEVLVYGAEIGCSNAVISTEEIVEEEEGDVKVEVKNIVTVNEKERKIKHYRSSHKILLVGEGDFSFSACLALAFGSATNIVATSLNKLAFLKKNYGNVESNIMEIRSRGGRVMHGIDATQIANHQLLPLTKYDRIVFNFPFAGFFRKLPPESQLKRHRRLVSLFLKNAKEMISENGEIHISHKTNGIHAEFKLESIASSHGLRLVKAVKFKEVRIVRVVVEERWIKHYSSRQRILLVGEGNFSFSACLAKAFRCASNIVATSLDSQAFLKKNYGNAKSNILEIRRRGGRVMHGIDATQIANHQFLPHTKYDRIVFNFPFAGFFPELPRQFELRLHRRLVSLFLKNAKEMISENGEIHISHKTNGNFHAQFYVESIASSHGLRLIEAVGFERSDYPGYNAKYGFGGDDNFNCVPSKTFKFSLKTMPY